MAKKKIISLENLQRYDQKSKERMTNELALKEDLSNKINTITINDIDENKYPSIKAIYNFAKGSFKIISNNSYSNPFDFKENNPGIYVLEPSLIGSSFYYRQDNSSVASLSFRRIFFIVITRNVNIDDSNGDIGYYLYLNQASGSNNFRIECALINKSTSGISMTSNVIGDFGYLLNGIAQNIQGVKTFNAFPKGPNTNPTQDTELVNKKYVDNTIDTSINTLFFNGTQEEWEALTEEQRASYLFASVAYSDVYELTNEDRENLASVLGDNSNITSDITEEEALNITNEIIGGNE